MLKTNIKLFKVIVIEKVIEKNLLLRNLLLLVLHLKKVNLLLLLLHLNFSKSITFLLLLLHWPHSCSVPARICTWYTNAEVLSVSLWCGSLELLKTFLVVTFYHFHDLYSLYKSWGLADEPHFTFIMTLKQE